MGSETTRGARSSRRATPATSGPASSPASRGHGGRERSSGRGESAPEGSEELGPLTIERHRKDDGRALLLYELRERSR